MLIDLNAMTQFMSFTDYITKNDFKVYCLKCYNWIGKIVRLHLLRFGSRIFVHVVDYTGGLSDLMIGGCSRGWV